MTRRTRNILLVVLAGALSVGAAIVRDLDRQESLRLAAQAAAAADSARRARQAHVASARARDPALPPAPYEQPAEPSPADGPKRAGPAQCAYRAADGVKLGRVLATRAEGSGSIVTVLVDPAADPAAGGTRRDYALPAEVRVESCQR